MSLLSMASAMILEIVSDLPAGSLIPFPQALIRHFLIADITQAGVLIAGSYPFFTVHFCKRFMRKKHSACTGGNGGDATGGTGGDGQNQQAAQADS